jgi:hypothetical protein
VALLVAAYGLNHLRYRCDSAVVHPKLIYSNLSPFDIQFSLNRRIQLLAYRDAELLSASSNVYGVVLLRTTRALYSYKSHFDVRFLFTQPHSR